MYTHVKWDISTYQKVRRWSHFQDFLYITECIYFQMNQFYCHPRNCWKQTVLRIWPNKECTDKFALPFGTVSAGIICDQWVS